MESSSPSSARPNLRASTAEAFGLWSRYAPLTFVERPDSGPGPLGLAIRARRLTPDIRLGPPSASANSSGTGARASCPVGHGARAASRVTSTSTATTAFDWSIGGGFPTIDFLEVLTHEIGHSLGSGPHPVRPTRSCSPAHGYRFHGLGTGYLLAPDIQRHPGAVRRGQQDPSQPDARARDDHPRCYRAPGGGRPMQAATARHHAVVARTRCIFLMRRLGGATIGYPFSLPAPGRRPMLLFGRDSGSAALTNEDGRTHAGAQYWAAGLRWLVIGRAGPPGCAASPVPSCPWPVSFRLTVRRHWPRVAAVDRFDLVVIGSGPAGQRAAIQAASRAEPGRAGRTPGGGRRHLHQHGHHPEQDDAGSRAAPVRLPVPGHLRRQLPGQRQHQNVGPVVPGPAGDQERARRHRGAVVQERHHDAARQRQFRRPAHHPGRECRAAAS